RSMRRNRGTRARKQTLPQRDKWQDCLIFRAADRRGGGEQVERLWGLRVTTSSLLGSQPCHSERSDFPIRRPFWSRGPPPILLPCNKSQQSPVLQFFFTKMRKERRMPAPLPIVLVPSPIFPSPLSSPHI